MSVTDVGWRGRILLCNLRFPWVNLRAGHAAAERERQAEYARTERAGELLRDAERARLSPTPTGGHAGAAHAQKSARASRTGVAVKGLSGIYIG